MNNIKQFINSPLFDQLSDEAEHNNDALQLLETINLSIESLIFFKERGVQDRVTLETNNLNNIFNYLKQVYETE